MLNQFLCKDQSNAEPTHNPLSSFSPVVGKEKKPKVANQNPVHLSSDTTNYLADYLAAGGADTFLGETFLAGVARSASATTKRLWQLKTLIDETDIEALASTEAETMSSLKVVSEALALWDGVSEPLFFWVDESLYGGVGKELLDAAEGLDGVGDCLARDYLVWLGQRLLSGSPSLGASVSKQTLSCYRRWSACYLERISLSLKVVGDFLQRMESDDALLVDALSGSGVADAERAGSQAVRGVRQNLYAVSSCLAVIAKKVRAWSPEFLPEGLPIVGAVGVVMKAGASSLTPFDRSALERLVALSSNQAVLSADAGNQQGLLGGYAVEEVELMTKKEMDNKQANESKTLSFMTRAQYRRFIEHLSADRKTTGRPQFKWGPQSALLFHVTAMTGIRPSEWPFVRYFERFDDADAMSVALDVGKVDSGTTKAMAVGLGPVLVIKTAKQNARREDNYLRAQRILVLDRWPESQIGQLRTILGFVAAECSADLEGSGAETMNASSGLIENQPSTKAWGDVLKRVRFALQKAWSEVCAEASDNNECDLMSAEKELGLYTARHLFAEEVRRSGSFIRAELAAMMGHTTLTNSKFYGVRTAQKEWDIRQHDFVLPRPWPGDAEEIMQWHRKLNPLEARMSEKLGMVLS